MKQGDDGASPVRQQHEQMLKLVAKGFFNELTKYGVNHAEVLTVAGHLLDNVLQGAQQPGRNAELYNRLFTVKNVLDEWGSARMLSTQQVSLVPLDMRWASNLVQWLSEPAARDSFYPPFPESEVELREYLSAPARDYFCILHDMVPVGIIGAENIDARSGRLEMRKLVGSPAMHGKGIGKRATFLFLFHAFLIRKFHKVFLHSLDINIRNLNLNSRFGFALEGVFFEEAVIQGRRHDVVRMSLTATVWEQLFS